MPRCGSSYELRSTRLPCEGMVLPPQQRIRHGVRRQLATFRKAALLDGLEWNVRLSSVATPDVLRKFEATSTRTGVDPTFEMYDPDRDGARLDEALSRASGRMNGRDTSCVSSSPAWKSAHIRISGTCWNVLRSSARSTTVTTTFWSQRPARARRSWQPSTTNICVGSWAAMCGFCSSLIVRKSSAVAAHISRRSRRCRIR